jgi:hypothetical protein
MLDRGYAFLVGVRVRGARNVPLAASETARGTNGSATDRFGPLAVQLRLRGTIGRSQRRSPGRVDACHNALVPGPRVSRAGRRR